MAARLVDAIDKKDFESIRFLVAPTELWVKYDMVSSDSVRQKCEDDTGAVHVELADQAVSINGRWFVTRLFTDERKLEKHLPQEVARA